MTRSNLSNFSLRADTLGIAAVGALALVMGLQLLSQPGSIDAAEGNPLSQPISAPVSGPVVEPPRPAKPSTPVSRPVTPPVSRPVTPPISRPITPPVSHPLGKPIGRPGKPAVDESVYALPTPQNVQVTADDGNAVITWDAIDQPAVFPAYSVYRSTSPITGDSPNDHIDKRISIYPIFDLNFTDDTVQPGQVYYYRVAAFGIDSSFSALSQEIMFQISTISRINLLPRSVNLGVGQSRQIRTRLFDQNNRRMPASNLLWLSNNESVATVDASGVVTGTGSGQTTILAIDPVSGTTGEATVRIKAPRGRR